MMLKTALNLLVQTNLKSIWDFSSLITKTNWKKFVETFVSCVWGPIQSPSDILPVYHILFKMCRHLAFMSVKIKTNVFRNCSTTLGHFFYLFFAKVCCVSVFFASTDLRKSRHGASAALLQMWRPAMLEIKEESWAKSQQFQKDEGCDIV